MNEVDKKWEEGFETAIDLVMKCLENSEAIDLKTWAILVDEIYEEIDLFKKEGQKDE